MFSECESTFLPFTPTQHKSMDFDCVGCVLSICSLRQIDDAMKRTLPVARIGQDNTCGKYRPGQTDRPGFCCKLDLKDEAGQEARGTSSQGSAGSLMPGQCEGQGQQKAQGSGFLEPAPYNPAYPGSRLWTGPLGSHSPWRFLLPVGEPASPGLTCSL